MNPPMVSFGCTALMGTNKRGTLTPNADGYYRVVLGALNHYNSRGQYYPRDVALPLFEASGSLMRRIATGNLRGECGHPRQLPGMSDRDYTARLHDIDEKNVAFHIRRIDLVDGERDEQGRPITLIIGEVRPSAGPQGIALKDALDNRSEDVCFSIRAFSQDFPSGGRYEKHLKQIVTWDWVNEPGLSAAHKWRSPSLESLVDIQISRESFMVALESQARAGVAMESSAMLMQETLSALGWNLPQTRPPSDRW